MPPELTEDLPPYRVCMKGTNQPHPRCVALQGEIGVQAVCTVYALRSSPCCEFGLQWKLNQAFFAPGELERCNHARAVWGLPPLELNDFIHEGEVQPVPVG